VRTELKEKQNSTPTTDKSGNFRGCCFTFFSDWHWKHVIPNVDSCLQPHQLHILFSKRWCFNLCTRIYNIIYLVFTWRTDIRKKEVAPTFDFMCTHILVNSFSHVEPYITYVVIHFNHLMSTQIISLFVRTFIRIHFVSAMIEWKS